MSNHGSAISFKATDPLEPRPLELSLNPVDGSLLTAPLTQVLLASTDALYQDLYNMAHGELDVTTSAQLESDANAEEDNALTVVQAQTRRERMSNLSFAQRRHELSWRLAQHGRTLQHVAGLTAADASSEFSKQVRVSSTALQHARTAWVQADEAQDAMYFFHAQLFPVRAAPHDVYGAADVHLDGTWYDLPADLRLASDRYETVRESEYSRYETDQRWQMAVRHKLLEGEVAFCKRQGIVNPFDLSLAGGVLKLTHGSPRRLGTQSKELSHPIEALLTIVTSSEYDEWTLLNLDVRVEAKTGEFNHQLESSNRQRFDLHRLAALAMSREEARVRRLKAELKKRKQEENEKDNDEDEDDDESKDETPEEERIVSRPLHALFQMAHTFSLSWQLELLSAQAQALRRGAWSAGEGNQINVTPLQFLDESEENNNLLGAVSIYFWRVDDAYGPPAVDDLIDERGVTNGESSSNGKKDSVINLHRFIDTTDQLVLSIRAEKTVGIKVALSGGLAIRESTDVHARGIIQHLLEASSNPFALSASDALLAATQLCTERKCDAAVKALQRPSEHGLPPWITLQAQRGNISVAIQVSYYGVPLDNNNNNYEQNSDMLVAFRLACDARTGSFAPTFSRAMRLLRYLACNDVQATENVALRIASTPLNRRRAAGAKSTGRLVKEAFDGLVRSMNVLGQKVGVGGKWKNKDEQSASIRDRSIALACRDVTLSMTKCCGLAALFGLAPIAVSTALGLNAIPDMGGDVITEPVGNSVSLFATPPLSLLLDQQVIETSKTTSDGVTTKKSYLQQRLFGVSFAVSNQALTLYPLEIMVHLESPHSIPVRQSCSLLSFCPALEDAIGMPPEQPSFKRQKCDENGTKVEQSKDFLDLPAVVPRFAAIVSATIDSRRQQLN